MKKILLIEDNKDILENTAEILELAGYQVVTATDGRAAMSLAIESPPDLIISDIMMPVLDGYGLLHLVRKHPGLAGIPFIFLTAKTERIDFRKGMDMGADDYITKPFSDTELLSAVESRIRKMEQIQDSLHAMETAGREGAQTPAEALSALFADRRVNHYKRKQLIFAEGNHPQYLFYIVSGKVKGFKSSEDGKDLTVSLYAAGDFLGYTALLEDAVYRVSAEALEDAEVALIPRGDFFSLLDANPAVTREFMRLLAKNNNQKAEQMVQLAYNSLRKRVANALLLLQQKYQRPENTDFVIQLHRGELANLSGTATESLIRTLSDFRQEKIISIDGGDIRLLLPNKLRELVN